MEIHWNETFHNQQLCLHQKPFISSSSGAFEREKLFNLKLNFCRKANTVNDAHKNRWKLKQPSTHVFKVNTATVREQGKLLKPNKHENDDEES